MKINKLIIIGFITAFALGWEWPWSSSSETKNGQRVELPKGIFSILDDQSNIIWKGQKAIGGSHTGNLKIKNAEIKIDKKGKISGDLTLDMNTINCTDLEGEWKKKLEGHLKSDDFFGVNKFNESRIEFQSVNRIKNLVEFDAYLTIKNISHPLSFNANLLESKGTIIASSSLVFDRSKYDVKYGSGTFFENLGDNLILDEINIDVNLAINN